MKAALYASIYEYDIISEWYYDTKLNFGFTKQTTIEIINIPTII